MCVCDTRGEIATISDLQYLHPPTSSSTRIVPAESPRSRTADRAAALGRARSSIDVVHHVRPCGKVSLELMAPDTDFPYSLK